MAIELDTPDALEYKFYPVSNGQFNFKVRAANDAHIALTSGPGESDPMIEVFIGGWSNQKSIIRKNRTKPEKAEATTPNVLNAGEFRGFWIRWVDGIYTVGNEGEAAAFLSYQDDEQFPIGFAGVCTGWGATGSWLMEGHHQEIKTPDSLNYQYYSINSGSLNVNFRGPSNCHIALLSQKGEEKPLVELILGGWDNKASVIRVDQDKSQDHRVETPNLLNASAFTPFHISWNSGCICVRRGNMSGPVLMEKKDCVNFGVSYIGVRTAWGSKGSWKLLFGNENTHEIHSPGAKIPIAPTAVPRYGYGPPGCCMGAPSANIGGWAAPTQGGGPVCWVANSNGQVPPGALPGGQDGQDTLYIGRARHEGSLIPGKLVPSHGVVYIAWGGAEHAYTDYEVLCGGPATWVLSSGAGIPPNAIPAGETEEGEPLFVGRCMHEGTITIGKIQPSHNVCYISYGGAEIPYPEFEVLVN